MSIYDELRKDHAEVKEMFEELLGLSPRASRQKQPLFQKLKAALTAHSKGEERTIYQALKGESETRSDTLEAIEEHHVVDVMLREIARLETNDERWTAKLTVLKENVEHHIEEEENNLFPKAEEALSEEEADELGEKFATERDKILEKAG